MARVFVVQENPNVNILAAGHYGELIPLLKPGKQITLSSAPVVRLIRQKLKDYNDEDFILAMGEDCYKDEKRFPNGPYCKEGEWIIMRSYSGTRFKVHGKEFRLINDDSVEAVVEDPRGIVKVI